MTGVQTCALPIYKDLEKGKWVKVLGWEGPEAARTEILDGMNAYKKQAG